MAVLLRQVPALRLLRPREPGERPPRLLQGPRLAAALLALQGGRRDRRRGAAHLPRVRLAPAGPPDAGASLGRRRHRLARPGPADLGRDRARRRPARVCRLPGLGPLRRLRARRGLDVGGLRARRPRRPRQPDRDRRRQPARPARPDHARVGHRLAGGARRAPAAGTCRRSTATTSRRSTPPTGGRSSADRPAVIFARTKKGSGVAAVEDKPNQHGKPLADPEAAVEELGGVRSLRVEVAVAAGAAAVRDRARRRSSGPAYEVGEKVATRGAYGDALAWIGSVDEKVVALDGEVGNSTYAERFAAKHPERFFEMYIAEQQMVAAARRPADPGLEAVRLLLRRLPQPRLRLRPHGGDLRRRPEALRLPRRRLDRPRRALADGARRHRRASAPCSTASCSTRATPTRRCSCSTRCASTAASATCARPARRRRCSTGRTRPSRSAAAARCAPSDEDAVTLIGAGITLHECLTAADELAGKGIAARVIDLYSVKPVDADDPAHGRRRDAGPGHGRGPLGRRAGSARPSPACSPKPARRRR